MALSGLSRAFREPSPDCVRLNNGVPDITFPGPRWQYETRLPPGEDEVKVIGETGRAVSIAKRCSSPRQADDGRTHHRIQ